MRCCTAGLDLVRDTADAEGKVAVEVELHLLNIGDIGCHPEDIDFDHSNVADIAVVVAVAVGSAGSAGTVDVGFVRIHRRLVDTFHDAVKLIFI